MVDKYLNIIANSYSQIFFSKNKFLGFAIMLVSFFDFWIGFMGLLSVVIAVQTALWFKFDKQKIIAGLYGFNALLVGLGTAVFFGPSIRVLVIVVISAVLTLLLTLAIEGILSKYMLPFLSIPFLLAIWIIDLSYNNLIGIGVSERGIYHYSELYSLGGQLLVDLHIYLSNVSYPFFIKDYFLSLSAIAFQYNELAGLIIAIGLLVSSRIAFSLSIIGFYIAILFYKFVGIDYSELSYTYIGFNYILTSIALGGIFLIPSKWSYSWMLILLPITVILTFGMGQLFYKFDLPIYSLPFNVVVLTFLYVMKLRLEPGETLVEPIFQYNSPEKNIYQHVNIKERFPIPYYLPVYLPVLGEWNISQGHQGEHTHIGEWSDAWDFIILDSNNSQFKNSGDYPEDYYCYNKPVVASADGTIVEMYDTIEDNTIGEVNTLQNWGNSIVIKHSDYLFSQYSHLKADSFKVKKGDFVKKGQLLATVGNSGRSPYPHLHFQFQLSPYIGSKTFKYPFEGIINNFQKSKEILNFAIPNKNDKVSNIEINALIQNAFNFIPGQRLKFYEKDNIYTQIFDDSEYQHEIEVWVDAFNNSYFKCLKTDAVAYFDNNGSLFQFISYIGNKNSFLYILYLSLYKLEQGFYKDLEITDNLPIDNVFSVRKRFLQDFVAPFKIYLKAKFKLRYVSIDNDFMPSEIRLESIFSLNSKRKLIEESKYTIKIEKRGLLSIEKFNKNETVKI
ncbi:urea transporter [Yeosuana marina]|uniref:urea transporter n=1 Tax=Yeosuana marina TaxID=1565536 RepID=UPI0030C7BA87